STQLGLIRTGFPDLNPIHFDTADPACPDAAKLGTVQLQTPLLEQPLTGSVYLAAPFDTPFHTLLGIYIVVKGPGIILKLPGKVTADPTTGQLTTTFDDNPQLPFSDLTLDFAGGPRAALVTPAAMRGLHDAQRVDVVERREHDLGQHVHRRSWPQRRAVRP